MFLLQVNYLLMKKMNPTQRHTVNAKNIGCALIAKELQMQFSLKGKGDKRSFEVYTNIMSLIHNVFIEATSSKAYQPITESEVRTAIGEFLKHSPARRH